jgi:predicted nuclease of predicted toxin-antitoxin system
VRFLVDENLSLRLASALGVAGHDAVHVAELGMSAASDLAILEAARTQNRIILSSDTDFGTLLAGMRASAPSTILVRRVSNRRVEELAALILANLDDLTEPLENGAVVVIEESRIRVRPLPLA